MTLLKDGKADLLRTMLIGIGTTEMEFYSRGDRLAQLQHGQVRILSQEQGWGAVDGKLLRENNRGKGGSG